MLVLIMFLCSSIVCASKNIKVIEYSTKAPKHLVFDHVVENNNGTSASAAAISERGGPPYVSWRNPNTQDYGPGSHYRNYKKGEYKNKKPKMLSMLKSLSKGVSDDSHGTEYNHPVEDHGHGGGWGDHGWGGDDHHHYHHKHIYSVKGGGHSTYFSFLDIVLTGLSLISFGAFLLNLLMNLLSLGGFFTTTATYPTYTVTGTATSTGGNGGGGTSTSTGGGTSTSTGGGTITVTGPTVTSTGGGTITVTGPTVTSTGPIITGLSTGIGAYKNEGIGAALATSFTNNWLTKDLRKKKKKGKGTIKADAGFGGVKGKGRRKRFAFETYVDPYTSLDIAARSILNSIQAMTNKYECIEKVFCDSNKHAGIVGRGLEYFMPVYSLTASYFGRKLDLHEKLPDHVSAIILGVQESNCQRHFPQCASQS